MFISQQMRSVMKRAKDQGVVNIFISIPLNFLRDYSCPSGDELEWSRTRAAIIPITLVGSFFFLNGNLDPSSDDFGFYVKMTLLSLIPGFILAFLIKFKTASSNPPSFLMTISAFLCFMMSIMWIQFTSACIIDMLQLLGWVTRLPKSLFGLTILAWGNSLGDMSADMAMTRKGFGEMAITGTMAGPIFNILVG